MAKSPCGAGGVHGARSRGTKDKCMQELRACFGLGVSEGRTVKVKGTQVLVTDEKHSAEHEIDEPKVHEANDANERRFN
eukprot:7379105-Prymnesium_polylepis.1